MTIAFIWQGLSQNKIYGHWGDGLKAAMVLIEKKHKVIYLEPWQDVPEEVDIILYWEAPCTLNGENRSNYLKVQNNKKPKILLFAGGPIKKEWCTGFDLYLVESEINEKEFEEIGQPWMRAFGVDTEVIKPIKQPKIFDAVFPATCAGWKRQTLFSKALGSRGVLCGRFQESDPSGFLNARENGTLIFPELPYEAVNTLYNASWCCVNTSEYWGGGQRTTLEAMAAGIPVIVMSDSPKNIEYVKESGAGIIVEPNEESIRNGIEQIKKWPAERRSLGVEYIQSKWTARHYADNILKGINKILNK